MLNYDLIEKINFKNNRIDDISNIKLFETFNAFLKVANEHKLEYILTGSFGLAILTNKIYRSLKDIDIITTKNNVGSYLNLFPNNIWFYNFNKNLSKINHIKNKNHVEILYDNSLREFYTYKNNELSIKIANKNHIFKWKRQYNNHQSYKKHMEDIEFYSQFLT